MHPADSTRPSSLPQIEDKLQFLKDCVLELESQIENRTNQWRIFQAEIQEQTLELRNKILHIEQIDDIRVTKNPRRKATLEVEIQKLEKEKRQQELDCWRDTTALQKELRQLRKEYRAVKMGLCSNQKN